MKSYSFKEFGTAFIPPYPGRIILEQPSYPPTLEGDFWNSPHIPLPCPKLSKILFFKKFATACSEFWNKCSVF